MEKKFPVLPHIKCHVLPVQGSFVKLSIFPARPWRICAAPARAIGAIEPVGQESTHVMYDRSISSIFVASIKGQSPVTHETSASNRGCGEHRSSTSSSLPRW
jgi:hypothetical protein